MQADNPHKSRTVEKMESIVIAATPKESNGNADAERLLYGKIEGPGVTLAYMADDKNHVCDTVVSIRCKTIDWTFRQNQSRLFYDHFCWF